MDNPYVILLDVLHSQFVLSCLVVFLLYTSLVDVITFHSLFVCEHGGYSCLYVLFPLVMAFVLLSSLPFIAYHDSQHFPANISDTYMYIKKMFIPNTLN